MKYIYKTPACFIYKYLCCVHVSASTKNASTSSPIVLSCAHCRLGVDDRSLERFLVRSGCEVHCFDPSLKLPHLQQAEMWLHRLSIDWRDPNPAVVAQRQHTNTKKLATILNDFGHRQVRQDKYINNFQILLPT